MMAETELASTIEQTFEHIAMDFALCERDLGIVLAVAIDQIKEWRLGRAIPEGQAALRFEQLSSLHRHLPDTFETTEAIPVYLRGPLPSLAGRSPLDALLAVEIDHVEGALDALDSGIFT